jgi:hypothetical protein
MSYDYSKLNGLIIEKFQTKRNFARAMHITERSLSNKLNNKLGWKQQEIDTACEILSIKPAKIHLYFFTLKVQKN